jgi:hemoglobin
MFDPEPNLYLRLGGYDAVAAFVDELLSRLTKDSDLAVYWKGKSADSLKRDRQLLVDFLCMTIGGPVHYVGRDMKSSHKGLGITERHWNIFARYVDDILNDLGVGAREKNELIALAAKFKSDIVEEVQ